VTRSNDLPARDLRERDLPERIARLERLLDGLEDARRAGAGGHAGPSDTPGPSPIDRLRDIAAVLQQRATVADVDEGDALAMRALLEELTSITASLRTLAADVEGRLGSVGAAVDDTDARLKTLEEIE
jgi:hypothetical protein